MLGWWPSKKGKSVVLRRGYVVCEMGGSVKPGKPESQTARRSGYHGSE